MEPFLIRSAIAPRSEEGHKDCKMLQLMLCHFVELVSLEHFPPAASEDA